MPQNGRIALWGLPVAILVPAAVVWLLGDDAARMLAYTRGDIAAGEVWRLLSGHWVHLGGGHFWIDAAGLLLVWYLVGNSLGTVQWLLVCLSSLVVMDVGFWWLLPGLDWYVGLSGLLHGIFAAGIAGIWRERRLEAGIMTALLVAKLLYEAFVGPLPGSENTAGGAVVTEAHLLGAIGGVLPALYFSHRVRPAASI